MSSQLTISKASELTKLDRTILRTWLKAGKIEKDYRGINSSSLLAHYQAQVIEMLDDNPSQATKNTPEFKRISKVIKNIQAYIRKNK